VLGLELVVLLGLAILGGSLLARRLRIATPVVLLVLGMLLGFFPELREARLPPEVVLFLFLPALLYWESLTTSLREIRTYQRAIASLSIVLVVVTAAAVAVVAHALGLPWGPAWVLGAAVAPTDPTAVAALAGTLPRRDVTLLRAESLVNDGTALVIYGLAVGVTVGEEHLSFGHVSWLFLLSYAGGLLAGVVVAFLGAQVRRRIDDPLLGNVAMLLMPFLAFLLADQFDASGVLAVVTCGLIMSQVGPRVVSARTRRQAEAFWSLATYLLNGALFVLVGVELQSAVRGLTSVDIANGLVTTVILYVVAIGARFVWLFTTPYLIRLLDRRPRQLELRFGWRARMVTATAGFRGAVSLAAALAVPLTLTSGQPFPRRDLIIFITAGVIVLTLLVQGLILPKVVRWARLPPDTAIVDELHLARTTATEEALAAIPEAAPAVGADKSVASQVAEAYREHLRVLNARYDEDEPTIRLSDQELALRLALIGHKRQTVLRLRDDHQIDDTVLRQVQRSLDVEEVRLSQSQEDAE
jgi:CPA1 family monovalent cation:H+ antiporter